MGIKFQLRFFKWICQITLLEIQGGKMESDEDKIQQLIEAGILSPEGSDDRLKDKDGEPTIGFLRGE